MVAVPPLIVKLKSPTSSAPEPPVVSKTASLKVTAMVVLSAATVVPVMVGAVFSTVSATVEALEILPAVSIT